MVVLVGLSAFFSASETAFMSLNRHRIKSMVKLGNQRANTVLALSDRFDELLSTLLVGNNLVNILASSMATVIFVGWLGNMGVTVSTVVMTVAILIFGEITPKMLAKESSERVALAVAPILKGLMLILTPVNRLAAMWKKLLAKLFKHKSDGGVTEEDLLTIVDEAELEGGINEHESDLIRSAIEFNDLDVGDILTPRVDIVAVEEGSSLGEIEREFKDSGYSRIPVYRDNIDNIVGVIHEKDFYAHRHEGERMVAGITKAIKYIPTSAKISDVLRMLQKSKVHMAVVTDEYGGTVGLVTLEDIIEELVGEIYDEHDEIVEVVEKLPDGRYRIAGSAEIDLIDEMFDIPDTTESSTISGWVTEQSGRIPEVGEEFEIENMKVTVTQVDARKVLEIIVELLPEESTAAAAAHAGDGA